METSSRRSLEELFSSQHNNNTRKDNTDMRTSKYYVRDDCSVSKNEMIQTRAPLSYYVRDVCSVSKNEICQSIKKIRKTTFQSGWIWDPCPLLEVLQPTLV